MSTQDDWLGTSRRGKRSMNQLSRDEHQVNINYTGGPQGVEIARVKPNATEMFNRSYVDPNRETPANAPSEYGWDSAQRGPSSTGHASGALEAIVAARTAQRQAEGPTVHPHLRNPYQDHP